MCDCQKTSADSNTIGVLFEKNKAAVAQVFHKYSMGHVPPTAEWAVIGAKAHGQQFANEVAAAAAQDTNNVDGGTLAADISGVIGAAAGLGVQVANTVEGKPATPTTPAPTQPQPVAGAIFLGLTRNQLLLIVLAAGLIITAFFISKGKK